MDISKYTAYFHDGSIIDIQHTGNRIEISMSSAEISDEDIGEDIILSKEDRICGKLHLEGVTDIRINEKPFLENFKLLYDNGSIFDFKIKKKHIELCVIWENFPPKSAVNEFSIITIAFDKIYWENMPDLPLY